jgi:hypothetical protein
MKTLLTFIIATFCLANIGFAEWSSSGLSWYWPETVPIAFVDNIYHTWSAQEKRECAEAITERFKSRTKRYVKQQIPGRESIGDIHIPGVGPSWPILTRSTSSALISVEVRPTSIGAPGEVYLRPTGRSIIRIHPSYIKNVVKICRHEGRHLTGESH